MKRLYALLFPLILFPVSLYGGTISYEGSSTIGNFMKDASKVYQASKFKIYTRPESAGGERCAAREECDMGGVATVVKKKYLKQGLVATLIGKDAISVIVNSENPIKGLTSEELKGIFSSKITNWKVVGGPDQPIKPMIVKKKSATRETFKKTIMKGTRYKGYKVISPDIMILKKVSQDRWAIGQLSFAFLKERKGVRALVVDGQEPSVNNTNYPITRPLYIVTKGPPKGEVKAFLDWALSEEGQKVVKKRFVGVK